MKHLFLIFVSSVLLLSSCSSKDGYISEYREFISEVKSDYRNYSAEEWEEADKKFNEYSVEMYDDFSDELSDEEVGDINILSSIYLAIKISAGAENKLKESKDK